MSSLNFPEKDITLIHDQQDSSAAEIIQTYDNILIKGPHRFNFKIKSEIELVKVIYNLDYTQQCGSTTQPASGEKKFELSRTGKNSLLLNDPVETVFTTEFLPDRYQYKSTYYPGITTIDREFNTMVHQLSVTVAQPSFNTNVNDLELVDVRTFIQLLEIF